MCYLFNCSFRITPLRAALSSCNQMAVPEFPLLGDLELLLNKREYSKTEAPRLEFETKMVKLTMLVNSDKRLKLPEGREQGCALEGLGLQQGKFGV